MNGAGVKLPPTLLHILKYEIWKIGEKLPATIFIVYNLVLHDAGRLGVISMLRMKSMLEGSSGSECQGNPIKMKKEMKMLITFLKLVQWSSYLD